MIEEIPRAILDLWSSRRFTAHASTLESAERKSLCCSAIAFMRADSHVEPREWKVPDGEADQCYLMSSLSSFLARESKSQTVSPVIYCQWRFCGAESDSLMLHMKAISKESESWDMKSISEINPVHQAWQAINDRIIPKKIKNSRSLHIISILWFPTLSPLLQKLISLSTSSRIQHNL